VVHSFSKLFLCGALKQNIRGSTVEAMMKKRKSPIAPQDDGSDDSAVELVEAGEEKVEVADSDDDSENQDVEEQPELGQDNSFMDTFYGLSSSNPTERAQAAHAMLEHCLVGPEANLKDAAYALKRLLNGLCSGRAASRQGNASALASFLKVALPGGQLKQIQESQKVTFEDGDLSILEYVRQRLLKATDPSQTQGRKKGSEERDYQFGRLFGILGVVRSGILMPTDESDLEQVLEVASGFVSDLLELYWHKKWMREPAAHAIGTILNTFYDLAAHDENAKKIAQHLVTEQVIPRLLQDEAGSIGLESYSAEQIAVAAIIQSHTSDGLPSPLDKPVISADTIPVIAKTLEDTSSVAQPRMHLVWDAIWTFITEPNQQKKNNPQKLGWRTTREDPLLDGDSTSDITELLVRHVVVEGLLRVDTEEGKVGKTTHEKRVLALSIVRNLMGVPFTSSIIGPTKLELQPEDVGHILTPVVIRRLFIDVICAGSGGKKKAHTLKPLALQSLELMTAAGSQDFSDRGMERRIATAQYIVKCEPKFDALTKTTTIAELVGLSEVTVADYGAAHSTAVQKYFGFLEGQIQADLNLAEKLMYVDLLYHSAKRLLRLEDNNVEAETKASQEFIDFKPKAIERVLGFFMASAFFDCADLSVESKTPKKNKKGKKKSLPAKHTHMFVEAALRIQDRKNGTMSYEARSTLSERFYSLLAEYINASLHSGTASGAKDSIMLDIVSNICNGWKQLEAAGAKPLFTDIDAGKNEDGNENESPDKIVSKLQGLADDLRNSSGDSNDSAAKAQKRCAVGCAALASTLFLHLLGCGKPEDIMEEDEVTTEDDDDSADILEAIEEIGELTPLFLDAAGEKEENPLAAFAEVCMHLFSSGLSSGSAGRGASPRLLREAIKFAWMGVLSASAQSDQNLLDSNVVAVLMNGIGAGQHEIEDDEGEEMEEIDDNDNDEETNSDDDIDDQDGTFSDFSKVGDILGNNSDDDDENEEASEENKSPEPQNPAEDEEVELNSDRLNSLLEDDSDADIDMGELEHHEGADAALAQLIKLRQDARKSSRKARERLEHEKQIRCTLLLETLLGKSESWAGLLRSDIILDMAMPVLLYRNKIEKSLSKVTGKSGNAEASTKKAMVDRLTSILKTKLFKLKFAGMQTNTSVDFAKYCRSLALSFLDMARKNISKDQRSCCSLGMVTILKALAGSDEVLQVAALYVPAVEEWSTKGTSRLDASLFEEMIHHCPRYVHF